MKMKLYIVCFELDIIISEQIQCTGASPKDNETMMIQIQIFFANTSLKNPIGQPLSNVCVHFLE